MRHRRSAAGPIQASIWIIALTSALAAGCREKVPEQAVCTVSQPPSKTAAELRTIHQDIGANASQCLSCHCDKILADSKNPSFPAFHKLHVGKAVGPAECATCHVSFDMVARPRVHVADRSACTSCHESLSNFNMGL